MAGLDYLKVRDDLRRAYDGAPDRHVPARFFSWRTDDQMVRFARQPFDIVDFHVAQEGTGRRFQSLTLRRPEGRKTFS